jgi:hypothetical protein
MSRRQNFREALLKEFWGIFFGREIVRFCWGFWGNEAGKRGVLVVNLWWMCGETWCLATMFSGTRNLTRVADLFFRDSRFGNWTVSTVGAVPLSSSE